MSALIDQSKQKVTTYTLEEASNLTKIGSFTLKMYLNSFPSHIGFLKDQSDSKIPTSSIPVLEQIRDLYRSGKSTEEIRSSLTALLVNNATKSHKKDSSKTHVIKALVEQREKLEEIKAEQINFQKQNEQRIDQKAEYFQLKLHEIDTKSQASYDQCMDRLDSFDATDSEYFQNQILKFEEKLKATMEEQTRLQVEDIHNDVLFKIKSAWEKQQKNNQYKIDKLTSKLERWETLFRSIIEQQVEHKKEIETLHEYRTEIDQLKEQLSTHEHESFFSKVKNYFKKSDLTA
ncbi:MAG: hypothetical protein KC646_07020 [Candidatus Cloacimonetes bacterium]|nr:hypothetical protein [Candidatus Cloacimonadota bacterium]